MKANRRLQPLLTKALAREPPNLPPALENLTHVVARDGLVLVPTGHEALRRSFYPDATGFECAANHAHVEDYVSASTGEQLRIAVAFARRVARNSRKLDEQHVLRFIFAVSDDGNCTVRFHVLRDGEWWIVDDVDGYQLEAVGFIDSDELLALT